MVSDPGDHCTENSNSVEVSQEVGAMEPSPNKDTGGPETLDLSHTTEMTSSPDLLEAEERAFVDNLYRFMKDRGTPIERIPHLGFKQINLWKIYKAVEALGGYDSVTARRLWKNVYDELGGSPGSTSAATCTRKHYERLVLPFERQLRGEEYKPLPPSKPRKLYKKSPDLKSVKPEAKRRRKLTETEEKTHSKETAHRSHLCKPGTCPHNSHWAVYQDQPHLDCPESQNKFGDHQTTALVVHESHQDISAPVPLGSTGVMSPLEKKKLLAQASLCFLQSPKAEDSSRRPTVIQCSPTPGCSLLGRTHNSSDGSPLPLSSPSVTCSRSPSPNSVSSEECLTTTEPISLSTDTKKSTLSNLAVALSTPPYSAPSFPALCKPRSCYPTHLGNLHLHHYQDILQASPKQLNTTTASKSYRASYTWSPESHGGSSQPPILKHPILTQSWVSSASSFTKVMPKSKDVFSPVALHPFHKVLPLTHEPTNKIYMRNGQEFSQSPKKLRGLPPLHFIDKKDKAMHVLPKPLPSVQYIKHSAVVPQVPYQGSENHLKCLQGQNPVHCPTHLPMPQLNPHQPHLMPGVTSFSAPYDFSLQSYSYTLPFWPSPTGLYPYPSNTRL
ncbi:AT-rich interactive domain-containing protein 5A isoform X1 [Alosa sapidissima]|uniref:AT-rich interactive domain-containing protein 5A isoform X1 n=2 Tax=Alosa sapidissima TaxID=34773 RepID=UPI001C081079|nr:AT-rich interactive domain-containing protein 5A isoform X1 [Alosa sapidissima]